MLRVQILHLFLELLWRVVNAKHAELERRSAHQLRLKAVEMLRSSTQLAKSHGDDLNLEYLWNGDEYGSLENSLKAIEKNAEYGGQPEILAPSAFYTETNHCSLRRLRQKHCISHRHSVLSRRT